LGGKGFWVLGGKN